MLHTLVKLPRVATLMEYAFIYSTYNMNFDQLFTKK